MLADLADDAALIAASDPLARDLVQPADDSPDVCRICRSWGDQGRICAGCAETWTGLRWPTTRFIPITYYRKPSHLRDWLTEYKGSDGKDAYADRLGAILGRFFREQEDALQETLGGYEAVCVVPSRERPLPHPLEDLFVRWVGTRSKPMIRAVVRGSGDVGHRISSETAFIPTDSVRGMRLLLIDDVLTTGATAQSAASALQLHGARVPAIVVIARRLNLSFHPSIAALWKRQARDPFSFADAPFWRR